MTAFRRGVATVLMLAAFSPLVSAQDGLPAGKGKTAFVRVCGACHGFDEITSLRMQKAGWETIVNDMITRGATGTDEEMAQALDYLANNFGVVVKVNQATVEEIRSGLGLARKDAEAIVKVRVEKGSFKGLADLLKVPGIDRARIEEQKGNLVF